MFTGLVETLGTIRSLTRGNKSVRIGVVADRSDYSVGQGDSVAIDGVCLTLEESANGILLFRAVEETLSRSTLRSIEVGSRVNLERAVRPLDHLGGHFVLGHVDCIGTIVQDQKQGDSLVRTFSGTSAVSRFIAEKGSVALDGISLTVASVDNNSFSVSFIPYSLAHTTMSIKKPGQQVNIEVDVLARYTARLLESPPDRTATHAGEKAAPSSLYEKMERFGF